MKPILLNFSEIALLLPVFNCNYQKVPFEIVKFMQGVKRMMVLVVNFFIFFLIFFFCFIVAIFDKVHDVEAIFHLH